MQSIEVYQDGNRFYREDGGECIYVSTQVRNDGDTEGAQRAREEFITFWISTHSEEPLFTPSRAGA